VSAPGWRRRFQFLVDRKVSKYVSPVEDGREGRREGGGRNDWERKKRTLCGEP